MRRWLVLISFVVVALTAIFLAPPVSATSGPTLVKDINVSGSSNPTDLTVVGNIVYFAADDGVHGIELWKSDGTAAGTKMVKNIAPLAKSSYPGYMTNFNGTLYFMADDGTHGQELWKSNGTAAGTVMVKDIHGGPKDQFGGNSTMLHQAPVVVGDRMFLLVDSCCVDATDIFVSDGTRAGTFIVPYNLDYQFELPDIDASQAHAYNGKLYFVTRWGSEYELWVCDGTAAGTHRVAGTPGDDVEMSILPVSGQSLYLYAHGGLWKTDGSAAGTKSLTKDNALESMPIDSAYMAERLYFNTSATEGSGLWKTNGTVAGTKEILSDDTAFLTVLSGKLYFSRGTGLWKTDGTSAGLQRVARFGTLVPHWLTRVGDKIVFGVPDWARAAWTLWKTNGTTAGTIRVRDFSTTLTGDGLTLGSAVGGRLFFAADDGQHGAELWSYTP